MSFLRRLLGGDESSASTNGTDPAVDPIDAAEEERRHELELARAESERLDELRLRQLRYADKAWTPPKQGGERRADDEDRGTERS